ncbi:MAG: transposase [Spirochaetes bacterium]|nr:transposase [Spirochaetota bacterium]MBU1081275.1 transposase [Spirochaetota bacterium]
MKRKRTIIDGAYYYVTVKTNGGRKYLESPGAKAMFIDALKRLRARHDCRVENFAVLDDGIQLLVRPYGATTLAEAMSWLFGGYTQRYNRVFDETGHLFGSRYQSRPVLDSGDLDDAHRRIDQAPVLAGLAVDAEDWAWGGLWQRASGSRDIVDDLVPRPERARAGLAVAVDGYLFA